VRPEKSAERYLLNLGEGIGSVIEYATPMDAEYGLFKMTSYYYFCQVNSNFGGQKLDEYEKDLDFNPARVNIDDAISTNQSLLALDKVPEWLRREIFALEHIQHLI
jgi:hypothetical protein